MLLLSLHRTSKQSLVGLIKMLRSPIKLRNPEGEGRDLNPIQNTQRHRGTPHVFILRAQRNIEQYIHETAHT